MAMPANTFATYEAIGNREDLSDVIYRIDPTDTPFMSGVDKAKASAVKHEWQTQALAAAAVNAQLEGDDATADTATPTARLFNQAQISRKVPYVTATQQAVNHAGRGKEMAYQEMLKGLELKRDMETSLIGSTQSRATGSDTAVRYLAPVNAWLFSNTAVNTSTGGVAALSTAGSTAGTLGCTAADGSSQRVDSGAQIAFTEAKLKSALQKAWNNGGKPDTIMVGSFNKQVFSTFTGRSSPIEQASSKKIVASVDAYESDFGKLKVMPNRFQRGRDAFAFQLDMWAVAYLNGRRMVSSPLANTGDSIKRLIVSEYTLECRNERANGAVFDNTTS